MKIAIIGCGAMGTAHESAYRALGHRVAAVCDKDIRRARALADVADCPAYQELAQMLSQESIDVSSICTPAPGHLPAIRLLSEAGSAILCEKPFVQNLEEAYQARQAVLDAGVPFRLGFKMRYEAVYLKAKQILDSGEIGKPRYAFISHFQPLSQPSWYMDVGVVTELLIHAIDMCLYALGGEPERVHMQSESRLGKAGEDKAVLQLDFSGGRRALITGGYMPDFPPVRGKHDFVFQFVGEKGYVCGKRNSALEVFSPQRIETLHPVEGNAFELEMADFLAAARGEHAGGATLEDALRSQRVLEAATRSRAREAAAERLGQ